MTFDRVRRPPDPHASNITLDTNITLDSALEELNDDAMSLNESRPTFAYQDELPRLPIPSLDETLNKFLQHVEALLDESQHRKAQKVVLQFLKTDGPKLQQLLIDYEQDGIRQGVIGSYVEEFWNESYLVPDQSVVLNLNPFFLIEDGPDPKIAKDPLRRAASLTFCAVKLVSSIQTETLLPDTFKGRPLCMDQFKAVFGAARVPSLNGDEIDVYPTSSHVVVLIRNQFYYFQALWPDGTVAVDEEDIIEILDAIQKNAKQATLRETSKNCPGVFTSLPRRQWAKIRMDLSQVAKNEEYLCILDSALFVLVLDEYIPKNLNDAAMNMLHGSYQLESETVDDGTTNTYQVGSCLNRWYDKLQIIVCGDGTAGINFEHSAIDGHTALRVVSDIYAETVVQFAHSIMQSVQAHGKIPHVIQAEVQRAATTLDSKGLPSINVLPKKMEFVIPEDIEAKIHFAETALGDQIVASRTAVLEHTDFGRLLITGNDLSPDSFVQMSIILAYYKVYGKMVCAYEPVLTKMFYHGRTEAMRPATMRAKELCEIFFNKGTTNHQKLAALRRATLLHTQFVQECARGKGVDRHLFALKCIAERNNLPIPPFFESEPWKVLTHTILSTSNCGNPSLRLFGFGPVVEDGLGIGYIIKDSSINFSVSSKHRQTQRYVYALEGVLKSMAALLKRSTMSSSRRDGKQRTYLIKIAANGDAYGDMWGANSTEGEKSSKTTRQWTDTTTHISNVNAKKKTEFPSNQAKPPLPSRKLRGEVIAGAERRNGRCKPNEQSTNQATEDQSKEEADQDPPGKDPQPKRESFDDVPRRPMRRGSMFTGHRSHLSMSNWALAQSGVSLDLAMAWSHEELNSVPKSKRLSVSTLTFGTHASVDTFHMSASSAGESLES